MQGMCHTSAYVDASGRPTRAPSAQRRRETVFARAREQMLIIFLFIFFVRFQRKNIFLIKKEQQERRNAGEF